MLRIAITGAAGNNAKKNIPIPIRRCTLPVTGFSEKDLRD
jgi:hypothetical protein